MRENPFDCPTSCMQCKLLHEERVLFASLDRKVAADDDNEGTLPTILY